MVVSLHPNDKLFTFGFWAILHIFLNIFKEQFIYSMIITEVVLDPIDKNIGYFLNHNF